MSNNLAHLSSPQTEIPDTLQSIRLELDRFVEGWLQSLDSAFLSSALYLFRNGGKRVRPSLVLSLVKDLTGDSSNALPIAFALECLHQASLVHDDLPALDNDELRRGVPTIHRQFDEFTAVLLGDWLPMIAFESLSNSQFTHQTVNELTAAFSKAYRELCEGQLLDMRGALSVTQLEQVHALKTGALFSLCFEAAGLIASDFGSISRVDWPVFRPKFISFGRNLGLAFQAIDDMVDLFGDKELTGREVSSDTKNQKLSHFTWDKGAALARIRALRKTIDEQVMSLHDVGLEVHVTAELIRQVFSRALSLEDKVEGF